MNAKSEKAASADLENLQEELARLREDVARIARTLGELGSQGMEDLRAAGSDKVEAMRRELDRMTNDLQRRGQAALADVEGTVRERPLTSLLLAFGLGAILSRLFLDRR